MGDDVFTDDVKEDIDAGGAHEFEILADGFQGGVEVPMRAEISLEGAVYLVQFENFTGIGNDGGQLAVVADDAGVCGEVLDVFFVEIGHFVDIKVMKGFTDAGPFTLDDFPGHAGLKNGFAHDLEVIVQ